MNQQKAEKLKAGKEKKEKKIKIKDGTEKISKR